MKPISRMVLILVLIAAASSNAKDIYYYSGGKQIPLRVDSTRITVKFDPSLSPVQREELIGTFVRVGELQSDSTLIDGFTAYRLKVANALDPFIDSLRQVPGLVGAEPYYQTIGGSPLLVGDRIAVGFKEKVSKSEIDSVNLQFGAESVYEIEGMPNVWVLRNTKASGTGALELANRYYQLSMCDFAHPIFSARPTLSGYKLYDHYHGYQSHIKRVIGSFNDRSVWDFAGLTESVIVAVIDTKIDAHEDLPASRILPGIDYVSTPDKPSLWHGMFCAGLIAASHTTDSAAGGSEASGIISLNPIVRILPITLFNGMKEPLADTVAAAITWAYQHGADIISCSWGYEFNEDDPHDTAYQFGVISTAIYNAHRRGRVRGSDTLGCTILFASGNSGMDYLAFPASYSSCVAVGAVHPDNDSARWYYSQYGYGLDLVAPSGGANWNDGVFTLDRMGGLGINPGEGSGYFLTACEIYPNNPNYYCKFNGTSAACPIAAGVASLLLSKDPSLLSEEQGVTNMAVTNILQRTAVHPGYDPDNQFGWGRVDAFRAVLSISHGDANNDGALDINDLFAIIDYLATSVEPFPSAHLADYDCDGIMDIQDMFGMVDYLMGLSVPVKPCFEF